jgi:2-C-methyl-D-erythritol 2,4-cyclodiphosphate synthase
MMIPSPSPLGAKLRIGFGYDIHRLAKGRALILGGVRIPFDRGLSGHSDADVICHAVADALLGAAALGDIGTHFPNDDPVWKDADSLFLLTLVIDRVRKAGYLPVNVDATLISEKPKIAAYARTMRSHIGKALRLPVSAVSVKATTNEGLGTLGRCQGMACLAVALLQEKSRK